MTEKNRLAAVPDTAMIPLCKALVSFLTQEAQGRGWDEVTARLKAVEAALTERGPQA
jgi:hypothetical protein